MTTQDLKTLDREFLLPAEIAPILGCDQYSINLQVQEDKQNGINSFPFPTIMIGRRVKIPRRPFLRAMGEESA